MSHSKAISFQSFNRSSAVKEILVFVLKLLLVYFLWRCFSLLVGPEAQPLNERFVPWLSTAFEGFNDWLKYSLAHGSAWLIGLFGYEPQIIGTSMVKIQGFSGVNIGNYCLAVELMVLYVALVATYPAPWGFKLGVILGGLAGIHLINMLRVAALNLMTVHLPEYADFNHHFTFRIVVFVVILAIYAAFVRKAERLVKNKSGSGSAGK